MKLLKTAEEANAKSRLINLWTHLILLLISDINIRIGASGAI